MIEALVWVAVVLAGPPVKVVCHAPTFGWQGAPAWAYIGPDKAQRAIYLKNCRAVYRGNVWWSRVFAHEILHLAYPEKDHWFVWAAQEKWAKKVRYLLGRYRA